MDALHTIYFAALGVMLAVNLLLAFRFRSTLPLLYSGALLSVAAIILLNAGSISYLAQPRLPADTRIRLIGIAGSCAALCAVLFWDRLVLLKIHAPRARYAVFAAGGLVTISGILMLIPGISPGHVEVLQQILSLGLLPTMAFTAILTLRAGYRPAIYSTIGILFFLVMAADYVAHTQQWFGVDMFGPRPDHLLLIGFLGEFVWFVLSLAGRATVLGSADSEKENIQKYKAEYTRRKYERSKLSGIDTSQLQSRLDQCMRVNRCYCDEDLTLDRLAELCQVSRHELSEYLNQRLGVNFNRFVNDYRVREVQERLRSEPERTMLDIAFSAGFNSKTRFNTEFKRVTGQTPRDYRQKI